MEEDESFRVDKEEYDKQWKLTKACNCLIRGLKNTWRGIKYVFKKPCNALYKGFSGAYNADWGRKWGDFTGGCSVGWDSVKWEPSRYGLPRKEVAIESET